MRHVIIIALLILTTAVFGQWIGGLNSSANSHNSTCLNCDQNDTRLSTKSQFAQSRSETVALRAIMPTETMFEETAERVFFTEDGSPVRLIWPDQASTSHIDVKYQAVFDSLGQKVALGNKRVVSVFDQRAATPVSPQLRLNKPTRAFETVQSSETNESVHITSQASNDNSRNGLAGLKKHRLPHSYTTGIDAMPAVTPVTHSKFAQTKPAQSKFIQAKPIQSQLPQDQSNQHEPTHKNNSQHFASHSVAAYASERELETESQSSPSLPAHNARQQTVSPKINNVTSVAESGSSVYKKVAYYGAPAAVVVAALKYSDRHEPVSNNPNEEPDRVLSTQYTALDRLYSSRQGSVRKQVSDRTAKIPSASASAGSALRSASSTTEDDTDTDELNDKIDDIEDGLNDLTDTVTELGSTVTDVQSDVSTIQGQVSTLQTQLGSNDVDALAAQIESLESKTFAGIAAAASLVTPIPSEPGKTILNVGSGYYEGQTAIGISLSRRMSNVNGYLYSGFAAGISEIESPLIRVGVGIEF